MSHIDFKNDLPGIRSTMAYRPETSGPLIELAEILLRYDNALTRLERELITTYVSQLKDCFYCHQSHGAIACIYANYDRNLVKQVRTNFSKAAISEKLKSLQVIAAKVQQSGKTVLLTDIEKAREAGASDRDTKITVQIAASLCMFNRYVDGLATVTPTDMDSYPAPAKQVLEYGYGGYHIYIQLQP